MGSIIAMITHSLGRDVCCVRAAAAATARDKCASESVCAWRGNKVERN